MEVLMRRLVILSLFCALSSTATVNAQTTADLRAPQTVTTGDYAALLLSEAYKLHARSRGLETTPIIMFNAENMNVIDFYVLSSADNLTTARARVDETVAWIRRSGRPLLERRLDARISDASFR